jgi:putative ABC transport system permease protein
VIGGALYLALRHALVSRAVSVILVFCFATAAALPLSASMLMAQYDHSLRARAQATPLVGGARGSRFDLVLATTHFRLADVVPTTMGFAKHVQELGLGSAIPMSVAHTARGHVVVGTGVEYEQLRRFQYREGGWPVTLGECVLGAEVARAEGLSVEDVIYSDQEDLYDISKAPAIRLHVVGVLEPTGTPDDGVLFVDITTAWLLDGIVHGHEAAAKVAARDPTKVLGKTGADTAISGALIEYQEVSPRDLASYHLHMDPDALPLTSVLIVPRDQKAATILATELNLSKTEQAVVPAKVMDELLAYVVRIKSVIDGVSAALIATNLLLAVLILLLSYQARERERRTMTRIGCSRWTIPVMFGAEFGGLVVIGFVVAVGVAAGLRAVAPELIAML